MTTATIPSARKPRTSQPRHGTARLELVITGTRYAARVLPADPESGVFRLVRLRKNDGTAYYVHSGEHGCGCDCPDFTFSRDGIDPDGCKHVKALCAVGLL